jgi:hypothetical protein
MSLLILALMAINAEQSLPKPGTTCYLFLENDANTPVATRRDAVESFDEVIKAKDVSGLLDLKLRGDILSIPTGTAIKYLKYHKPINAYESRVLEGVYKGCLIFVKTWLVRRNETDLRPMSLAERVRILGEQGVPSLKPHTTTRQEIQHRANFKAGVTMMIVEDRHIIPIFKETEDKVFEFLKTHGNPRLTTETPYYGDRVYLLEELYLPSGERCDTWKVLFLTGENRGKCGWLHMDALKLDRKHDGDDKIIKAFDPKKELARERGE